MARHNLEVHTSMTVLKVKPPTAWMGLKMPLRHQMDLHGNGEGAEKDWTNVSNVAKKDVARVIPGPSTYTDTS
jgi:hypothetical protein